AEVARRDKAETVRCRAHAVAAEVAAGDPGLVGLLLSGCCDVSAKVRSTAARLLLDGSALATAAAAVLTDDHIRRHLPLLLERYNGLVGDCGGGSGGTQKGRRCSSKNCGDANRNNGGAAGGASEVARILADECVRRRCPGSEAGNDELSEADRRRNDEDDVIED
ncbi:unnamed protein product, partial [Phaeothamnion confervicola]